MDETDRQLLALLEENARYTAVDLAERVGVSDNTVHNRIRMLEESGAIDGYAARVLPRQVGFDLYFLFVCTARISDREAVAEQALEVPNVVEVMELMTGRDNLQVKAVGTDNSDITRVAEQLDSLELEIEDEYHIRTEATSPLDYSNLEVPD